jgi:hypothetical protein
MKEYLVTESAGREVAGMRSPRAGKTISLTEAQAEHPLRLGYIVEAPKGDAPKGKGK